jgi:hypothetical protein
MEALLAICIGIGLSAACGFRIFVPLFGLSIAAGSGHVTLSSGFEWLGSDVAMIALGVATALEVGAYYIPWLDNLLDSIATPTAIVAGTMLTGAMAGEFSPFLKWTIAAIAGGGTAAIVQTGTTLVRGTSTATTGGIANSLVSTAELASSTVVTFMAIFIPALAAFLTAGLIFYIVYSITKRLKLKKTQTVVVES